MKVTLRGRQFGAPRFARTDRNGRGASETELRRARLDALFCDTRHATKRRFAKVLYDSSQEVLVVSALVPIGHLRLHLVTQLIGDLHRLGCRASAFRNKAGTVYLGIVCMCSNRRSRGLAERVLRIGQWVRNGFDSPTLSYLQRGLLEAAMTPEEANAKAH